MGYWPLDIRYWMLDARYSAPGIGLGVNIRAVAHNCKRIKMLTTDDKVSGVSNLVSKNKLFVELGYLTHQSFLMPSHSSKFAIPNQKSPYESEAPCLLFIEYPVSNIEYR